MKTLSIRIAMCVFTLLLNMDCIYAQQFQWVHGGGTVASTPEEVNFMCTDPDGNLYVLSTVGNDPIVADTFHATPYGGTNNTLLTSYTCNGQMRWAKLISSSGTDCTPYGIAADSLGHIYVAGIYYESGGTTYVGHDTAISGPATQYLVQGLIEFDTTGHFNWIRYVGNNTLATGLGTGNLYNPITIDGANNVHYLCCVKAGVVLMTGVTSVHGVYDLTYNPAGTLLSAIHLALGSQWFVRGAVIDPTTNKLYTWGEVDQSSGATDTFFAAAFDASRNRLWQYFTGNDTMGSGLAGITLDQSMHLRFVGGAASYITSVPTYFYFNGDTAYNTHYPLYAMSTIMTTDTNGTPLRIKKFDGSLAVSGLGAITLLPHNKIAAVGMFAGTVIDDLGNSIVTPPSEGQNPFLVIVDSAGDLQTIQQIHGNGFYDWGLAMASDRVGNIYLGGRVEDSIWAGVPAIPAYHSIGGTSDFYVMKYGVPCSCTSMPVASYTDTGNHIIGFTYTGTASTSIDSMRWNFGDGSTSTVTNPTHTYSATGTYTVCVTVYTSCGSDSVCSNVTVSTVGVSLIAISNVKVYPNPANDELYITGILLNTSYRLLNVTGESMQQGVLNPGSNAISIKNFAPGVYILEMTGADGERSMVRVVKE